MRRFVVLAVGCAAVLVGVAAASVPTTKVASRAGTACVPRWRVVAKGARIHWYGPVSALSATDVWAFGTIGKEPRTTPVAVNWDGRKLQIFRPFTRSSMNASLSGVVAVARDDVWAVGNQKGLHPVVVHWNGRSWKVVPTPRSSATGDLIDIAAFGANDVLAVGYLYGPQQPLVMRWNGQRWRVVDMSKVAPKGSSLYAIDGTSSSNVWVVGSDHHSGLMLHWDGQAWKQAPPFRVGAVAESTEVIDVVSPHEAWTMYALFGLPNNPDELGEHVGDAVVHWKDGTHRVEYRGRRLWDIAAVSERSVWIVGSRSSNPPYRPLVVHWDGRSWRIQRTALDRLKDAYPDSLSVLSDRKIWAAGPELLARYSC